MLTVQIELDFEDLKKECWSGAVDTLIKIEECEKINEFMEYLEELFNLYELPTMTELNDYLWFDYDTIMQDLEIEESEAN